MNTSGLRKVLIVDDEPDICFLFGNMLRRKNLETGCVSSLAEASSLLKNDQPSVIFLDNSLPDGSGINFIPYIKKHYPSMKVIMVTANDSINDRLSAYQSGADYFIGKPFTIDMINRALDQVL